MNGSDTDFVEAAEGIFGTWSGMEALDRCEWDPVIETDDPQALRMLGALFRAQGRSRVVTPALGMLAAAAFETFAPAGPSRRRTCGFNARHRDGTVSFICLGGVEHELLIDLADRGLFLGRAADIHSVPARAFDPELATTMTIPFVALEPVGLTDPVAARRRVDTQLWIAVAHEMLGVCDAVLRLAIEYAGDRMQFGRPIGSFQAVQHLLAEAAVDARGLEAACGLVVDQPPGSDDFARTALYLRALAGRASRRVLQATLQTFGAIGFTWEHEHHRYTRRVLTLDAIGHTTDQLTRTIGRQSAAGPTWRPAAAFVKGSETSIAT